MNKVFAYSMALAMIGFTIMMFAFISSFPLWLLWNLVIPPIFGLSEITILQAFGLWLLIIIIRDTRLDMNKIINAQMGDYNNDWYYSVLKKHYRA